MHRACRRSHISRAPFAPLGSGAHSAPAWAGWLPANFIAGSALLVFCSRVRAAAKHSVLTPTFYRKKNKFLKSGFVRLPLQQLKNHAVAACRASYAQCLSAGKKANFGWGQNLPFCLWRQSHFKHYIIEKLIPFKVKTKQISQFLKKLVKCHFPVVIQ